MNLSICCSPLRQYWWEMDKNRFVPILYNFLSFLFAHVNSHPFLDRLTFILRIHYNVITFTYMIFIPGNGKIKTL